MMVLLWLGFIALTLFQMRAAEPISAPATKKYHDSCSPEHSSGAFDELDKLRFECKVMNVCSHIPTVENPSLLPGRPHDLRIDLLSIVNPLRRPSSYQLQVNITWEPPYDDTQQNTKGFELNILRSGGLHHCYVFYLPNIHNSTLGWKTEDKRNSPRFRFTTVDLLNWGEDYHFELQPLPRFSKPNQTFPSNFLTADVTMPNHPEEQAKGDFNCSEGVNSGAHKWVAAFKSINIKPWTKDIFAEFYAAPPHYCFEAYEIRLHDGHGKGIVQAHKISVSELYSEKFGNVTVKLGNYTFKNVSVGTYNVGLIPLERSTKYMADQTHWRCLCPTTAITDPSQHGRVVCSCTEATWSNVHMDNPATPPSVDPTSCVYNPTLPRCTGGPEGQSTPSPPAVPTGGLLLFGGMLLFAVLALILGVCILTLFWRRYQRGKDRSVRMRILFPPGNEAKIEDGTGPGPGGLRGLDGDVPQMLDRIKLLLVFARDCPAHEETVLALAEYLSKHCYCDVEVDFWSMAQIAANKTDWVYRSMTNADKVLIINSIGQFNRFQHKIKSYDSSNNRSSTLVRKDASALDDLVLLQLNMAIQQCSSKGNSHDPKFLMSYFNYTPTENVLKNINPYMMFELPDKLAYLASHLHNVRMPNPNETNHPLASVNSVDYLKTLEGDRLDKSIRAMIDYQSTNPNWFCDLHELRVLENSAPLSPIPQIGIKRPSVSEERQGLMEEVEEEEALVRGGSLSVGPSSNCSSADSGLSSLTSSAHASTSPARNAIADDNPPLLASSTAVRVKHVDDDEEFSAARDSGFCEIAENSRRLSDKGIRQKNNNNNKLKRRSAGSDPSAVLLQQE